jgi:hypothetical protein
MKVDAYGNIKATNSTKKRSGVAKSGDFSSILDIYENEGVENSGTLSNVASPAAMSGMLALQEISDEEVRRKNLIKQGDDMLDSLEQLRRRLLTGSLPMHVLQNINKQLTMQKQLVNDPRLKSIIDEIELRTAVELAKIEMAIASKSALE